MVLAKVCATSMISPLEQLGNTGKSYKRLAWIFRLAFNKNPSWNGANSVNTILGLSVQGGNSGKIILGLNVQGGTRYGSTLVLSNKNRNTYIRTSTWVLFDKTRVEQHGFYTIPTLDVQSQDGFYVIRMGFC